MVPAKRLSSLALKVESPGFTNGRRLPTRHTRDGRNVSPVLTWSNLPKGAVTVAVICEDPDAPQDEPWVHWLVYNVPAFALRLPEGIAPFEEVAEVEGALQGINSYETVGYDGPSPPVGHGTHRYFFKLFAVDRVLDLAARATKDEVLKALDGRVLAKAEIMGTYSR